MTPETGLVKARGVHWDLGHLHHDAAEARLALDEHLRDAAAFAARHEGRIASMSAADVAATMRELAALINRFDATTTYIDLRNATDSQLAENKDLETAADRAKVAFANAVRFVDLEWQALPPDRAAELAHAPELVGDRHYLERLTEAASHSLSPDQELALAERSTAAVSAWQSLFAETVSAVTAPFDSGSGAEPHTVDELLAYVHDDRPDVRAGALDTLYRALEPWAPILAKCYDSLVGDRLAMDRLRHYVTPDPQAHAAPMQQANFSNDLAAQVVEYMMMQVEDRYPTAQRYFRLKAGLLGLPTLRLSDQYAPIGQSQSCDFHQARGLVLSAMSGFSAQVEGILSAFFSNGRIDAEPRAGKRGGAFCTPVAQNLEPMVLMNYTDSLDDAETLAHELGHGLHFFLAAQAQSSFSFTTGMAMAEVASTFNEMVLFDDLFGRETDPLARRALVCARIEGSFATIFRQTMMTRFEQHAYAAKDSGTSLTSDRLSGFWVTENRRYYGDTVQLPEGYRLGWSYIPHFIYTRFYTYSYSFAHLTSLALYARYRDQPKTFVEPYLDLLAAGGSESPEVLLRRLGIDIADPAWAEPAFDLIAGWIDQVETPVNGGDDAAGVAKGNGGTGTGANGKAN